MVRLFLPTPCSLSRSHPSSCPFSSCVAFFWLSFRVGVLVQPCFAFSSTAQTCQHTSLHIHQPCSAKPFFPYCFGDFLGTLGSCSTNYSGVNSLQGMMRRCWELACQSLHPTFCPSGSSREGLQQYCTTWCTPQAQTYPIWKKWRRWFCSPESSSVQKTLMNRRWIPD